jgi:hypothetical protein
MLGPIGPRARCSFLSSDTRSKESIRRAAQEEEAHQSELNECISVQYWLLRGPRNDSNLNVLKIAVTVPEMCP